MNIDRIGIISAISGIAIASFTGGAIARNAGFGSQSWLMLAFAMGVALISHGPILRLQRQVKELQKNVATKNEA